MLGIEEGKIRGQGGDQLKAHQTEHLDELAALTIREVGGEEDVNVGAAQLAFGVVKKRDKARERDRKREKVRV